MAFLDICVSDFSIAVNPRATDTLVAVAREAHRRGLETSRYRQESTREEVLRIYGPDQELAQLNPVKALPQRASSH